MEDMQKYMILGIAVVLLAALGSVGSSRKTDGVFESAMNKLDSGRQLSAKEQQRISDILDWCDQCNGPVRKCDH